MEQDSRFLVWQYQKIFFESAHFKDHLKKIPGALYTFCYFI